MNLYNAKFKRVILLMLQLQKRSMHVHTIAKEFGITERTAYRYLKLFKELEIELKQTRFNSYTLNPNESNTKFRPARRSAYI